jgi:hypothetical protein
MREHSDVSILPRKAGEGDHAQHGGGGMPNSAPNCQNDSTGAARPLHRPSGGPPPPLRFATQGRMATTRASPYCHNTFRISCDAPIFA